MAAGDASAAHGPMAQPVPVPPALFGPLLAVGIDADTLRCGLRAVFLLHRKGGRLPAVSAQELAADPVLALAGGAAAAGRALRALAAHGVLMAAGGADGAACYCLDTPANRRALAAGGAAAAAADADAAPLGPPPADVVRLYEEHIGVITPMAAERLKDMEAEYPAAWIAEAFREAVLGNARTLRYIEAILRRWRDHGRGNGEAGGRAGTVSSREVFRRSRR